MTAIPTNHRQLIPAGTREEFALVWGHRVRYLTAGTGPPLLLIPGLFGFSFSWSENISALAKHATVYAPDLLNTGYSDRAEIDTTLAGLADQVAAFMDAVGLPKADLVGSSHGGAVAMMVAERLPQKVGRLILVSPANWFSESSWRMGVEFSSTHLGRMLGPHLAFLRKLGTIFFVWHVYHNFSRVRRGTIDGYAQPLHAQTLKYGTRVASSWYKDFANLRASKGLLNAIQVLLVWGRYDRVVPLRTGNALLSDLPTARLVTLETGHLPYEELPEEFNRVVIDFLLRQQ